VNDTNRLCEHVLQDSKMQRSRDGFSLDNALENALIQDKEEFVHLFLDLGASLRIFCYNCRLHDLYKRVKRKQNIMIYDNGGNIIVCTYLIYYI